MVKFERLGVVLAPENEYQAKFNAGMIEADGKVHMLYRYCEKIERWHGKAIDWLNLNGEFPYRKNYICYAGLNLDGTVQHDANEPVIVPETAFESVGCEDPRIVCFEGSYYIFYTAYDTKKARVGIARTEDFISYEKMGIIDNFTLDKDAFIFPERIQGKIAYIHRIEPNIQLDYVDSFEELLAPETWAGYESRVEATTIMRSAHEFEAGKIGGGVPPIKTAKGWLFIYHGVDLASVYHIGAALLDLEDPSKVLARLPYPVLSPEADFETQGDYNGCVFAQGYFIQDGEIYVSYGTADKYTAIAKINLQHLLDELEQHRSLLQL